MSTYRVKRGSKHNLNNKKLIQMTCDSTVNRLMGRSQDRKTKHTENRKLIGPVKPTQMITYSFTAPDIKNFQLSLHYCLRHETQKKEITMRAVLKAVFLLRIPYFVRLDLKILNISV